VHVGASLAAPLKLHNVSQAFFAQAYHPHFVLTVPETVQDLFAAARCIQPMPTLDEQGLPRKALALVLAVDVREAVAVALLLATHLLSQPHGHALYLPPHYRASYS